MVILGSFDLSQCEVIQLLFQLIIFIHKLQSIVYIKREGCVRAATTRQFKSCWMVYTRQWLRICDGKNMLFVYFIIPPHSPWQCSL